MLGGLFSAWPDFAALLFGVCAVFFLFISAQHANERIAKLTAEAEASRAQIATANARAVEAQARLETLRRYIVHRMPDAKAMLPFLKQSKASVEILYQKEDLEATVLAHLLGGILLDAGWNSTLTPLSAAELAERQLWMGSWYLEAHSVPKSGMGSGSYLAFGTPLNGLPLDKSPFSLLVAALLRGIGIAASSAAGPNPALPEGHFRLFILPQAVWQSTPPTTHN